MAQLNHKFGDYNYSCQSTHFAHPLDPLADVPYNPIWKSNQLDLENKVYDITYIVILQKQQNVHYTQVPYCLLNVAYKGRLSSVVYYNFNEPITAAFQHTMFGNLINVVDDTLAGCKDADNASDSYVLLTAIAGWILHHPFEIWVNCYELSKSSMHDLAIETGCLPLRSFEQLYKCIKRNPERHTNGVMQKLLEYRHKSPSAVISEIHIDIAPQLLRPPSQRLVNNFNGIKHDKFGILYKFKYFLLFK